MHNMVMQVYDYLCDLISIPSAIDINSAQEPFAQYIVSSLSCCKILEHVYNAWILTSMIEWDLQASLFQLQFQTLGAETAQITQCT